MRNKSILKAFGIMLLVTFILTWVVPSSMIESGGVKVGSIAPTGFADIFTSLEIVATYFLKPALLILFVGMFYGVANESGALKAVVNKFVSWFKDKKNLFVVLTVLFYSVITALTGIYLPLFMFVPLSIAILFGLKYNKVQSILATVGASTIGLIAQVFNPFLLQVTNVTKDSFIWIKVGLLVVLVLLTIFYIIKVSVKKDKAESSDDKLMFVPQTRDLKTKSNVKGLALSIILLLLFVIFILGLTPWKDPLATEFTKAYDAINGVKIANFAIFKSILGTFEVFGKWTINSVIVTIAFATIVLSISNRVSFKEMIEESYNGIKKVAGLALLAALISLIVIFTLNSGFIGTIVKFIAKGGNIALVTIASFVGTPFMVDFNYAVQYVLSVLFYTVNNESLLGLYGFVVQLTYGFAMLVLPSSILLMVGLGYVEESYSKWLKYIWKFLLAVFVAILIAISIATLL